MLVGKRLKEARLKKGYTQQQLGQLINVTKVSICCYENDTRTPNLETFQDLLRVLDVSPNYLLGNDVDVIAEGNEQYHIRMAKEDIEIINQLKTRKIYIED